jgi:hypothetical protein
MSALGQACLKGGDEVQQLLIARANYVEAHNQYRSRLKLAAYRVCDELQITPHITELAKAMSVDEQQCNALAITCWLHDYLDAQFAASESVRLASMIEICQRQQGYGKGQEEVAFRKQPVGVEVTNCFTISATPVIVDGVVAASFGDLRESLWRVHQLFSEIRF